LINKIESLTKTAASTVAIVVSLILLSGYSYHLGYVMTYELSTDLISKSMSEVLVESWYVGVMALACLLSKWPYVLVYFLILSIIIIATFFFARWCRNTGKDWVFEETTKENQGKVFLTITQWQWKQLGGMFSDLSQWFYYPMALVAGIGVFTALPFQDAKEYARKQIELFQEHGCSEKAEKYTCIYLIDIEKQQNKVLAKGILVSANDKRVAIYNNKLEVWPLLDNYIIRKNTDVGWVELSETQQNHSPNDD
jgi:hypothetical protein